MPNWFSAFVLSFSVASRLTASDAVQDGNFFWECGRPVLGPEPAREDRCISVKDPSVVRFGGKWHLFATIRSEKRTHQIEYLNFERWEEANTAPRHVLQLTNGYFCAPQVFFYSPRKKWYLIHQISIPGRKVELQPAFSTTTNLFEPKSWTRPEALFERHPENISEWIDFWVIADTIQAHLFFTSFDGKLWRSDTALADFPKGWTHPEVVLKADIFEASHTYALKDRGGFLSLIEAQGPGGRRYYKAYRSDSLRGPWTALADSFEHPFASSENVRFRGERWTDSFSHGELLRAGFDEKLEIDGTKLTFLFQGVSDVQRRGQKYGDIPWRLGLLNLSRR